jgi:hypothetical protein
VGDTETRVGLNEGLFREVNDRIAELGGHFELAETEFVCELSHRGQTEPGRALTRVSSL